MYQLKDVLNSFVNVCEDLKRKFEELCKESSFINSRVYGYAFDICVKRCKDSTCIDFVYQ